MIECFGLDVEKIKYELHSAKHIQGQFPAMGAPG